MITISKGLSETDKQYLTAEPKVNVKSKKVSSGETTLEGTGVRWKDITSASAREWGCPFCRKGNVKGHKKCGTCGAFLFQHGDLQFVYKTPNRKQLPSHLKTALKELVLDEKSAAKQ